MEIEHPSAPVSAEKREPRKPFLVSCSKCEHVWPAAWLPMEVAKFAKVAQNQRCPSCGKGPKGVFVASKEQEDAWRSAEAD